MFELNQQWPHELLIDNPGEIHISPRTAYFTRDGVVMALRLEELTEDKIDDAGQRLRDEGLDYPDESAKVQSIPVIKQDLEALLEAAEGYGLRGWIDYVDDMMDHTKEEIEEQEEMEIKISITLQAATNVRELLKEQS